jgi:hypothetical protein
MDRIGILSSIKNQIEKRTASINDAEAISKVISDVLSLSCQNRMIMAYEADPIGSNPVVIKVKFSPVHTDEGVIKCYFREGGMA